MTAPSSQGSFTPLVPARVAPLDDPAWRELTARAPAATAFHHPAWAAALAASYRYPAFALTIEAEDGRAAGGLPLVEVASPIGHRRWSSLPFTDFCPPLWDGPPPGPEALVATLDEARRAAGVGCLEVRADLGEVAGVRRRTIGYRHVRPLDRDRDALLRSLPSTYRTKVRKAERSGVQVRWSTEGADVLDVFYPLHVRTRRRLGVPVQPKRLFRELARLAGTDDLVSVAIATHEGAPVAATLFLHWRGTLVYKYSASEASAWHLRPNDAVVWAAMCRGGERGYDRLDFGLTDEGNEGLRSFKRGWGATEEPLVWSVLGEPCRHGTSRAGTSVLAPALRRLPLWCTRLTGALLYRYAA